MLQTKNTIKVNIAGQDLLLYRRSLRDFNKWLNICDSNDTMLESSISSIVALHDSLVPNIKEIKWHRFIKRYRIKKIISIRSLLNLLSFVELLELTETLLEFEGIKKKVLVQENL